MAKKKEKFQRKRERSENVKKGKKSLLGKCKWQKREQKLSGKEEEKEKVGSRIRRRLSAN